MMASTQKRARTAPVTEAEPDEPRGTEQLPIFSWEIDFSHRVHPRVVRRRSS